MLEAIKLLKFWNGKSNGQPFRIKIHLEFLNTRSYVTFPKLARIALFPLPLLAFDVRAVECRLSTMITNPANTKRQHISVVVQSQTAYIW
jgi:hypothetical protein